MKNLRMSSDSEVTMYDLLLKNDITGVAALIANGGDINGYAETDSLETALHTCARLGLVECATLLLNQATKIQVDILLAWDANCKTPLRVAEDNNMTNISALLRAYPLQRRMGDKMYKQLSTFEPPDVSGNE